MYIGDKMALHDSYDKMDELVRFMKEDRDLTRLHHFIRHPNLVDLSVYAHDLMHLHREFRVVYTDARLLVNDVWSDERLPFTRALGTFITDAYDVETSTRTSDFARVKDDFKGLLQVTKQKTA